MSAEPTDASDPGLITRSPSFKGRLKLEEFMFRDSAAGEVSSRVSPIPSLLPSVKGESSTRKRKVVHGAEPKANQGKRKKPSSSGYAPPSTYAHLPQLLPDALGPNLLVLFVGLNPGVMTAQRGHAYVHPSNLFWKLLHSSGVTPRLCSPSEDGDMPRLYSLGLTNIVSRPSRNGGELAKRELDAGVSILERKARRWRPEVVCIVGKSIWESIWRVRHGRGIRKEEFRYGWQDEAERMGGRNAFFGHAGGEEEREGSDTVEQKEEEGVESRGDWSGARVFVASSTSGLAATLPLAEKERIWRELGVWVERRRAERAVADDDDDA